MTFQTGRSTKESSPAPRCTAGSGPSFGSPVLSVKRVAAAGLFLSSLAVLGPALMASPERLGGPLSFPAARAFAASQEGAGSLVGRVHAGEEARGEILVVDPGQALLREASRLRLTLVGRTRLEAVGAEIVRLAVPEGASARETIGTLRARFPAAAIGAGRFALPAAGPQLANLPPADLPSDSQETANPHVTSFARTVGGWSAVAAECGRGLRIGMIDAAVDLDHPALAGQRVEYRSFHNPERRPSEAVHGTAIAAMFVGKPSDRGWGGILPGAELKAANVFEYNDAGRLVGNSLALLKAFDWMVAEKVHVVNLSMAGEDNEVLRRVIEYARKRGLVTVAAAGNWGRSDRPAYPAAYEPVIAVTAFGPKGDLYDMANQGSYIDFAAPGVGMWTAVPEGGLVQSGTSFAVPYVSAQIAVQVAHGGSRDADELRTLLQSRAVDLGTPGKDQSYGWGYVADEPSCS